MSNPFPTYIIALKAKALCSFYQHLFFEAWQDSKIVFCGDFDQTDLIKQNEKNGLHTFLRILEEMEEFSCLEFTIGDIVRSGFVRNYLINKIKLGIGVE